MGLALAGLPVAGPLPDGLRIGIVEDLSELQIWVRTFLTGYEIPLLWEYDFYHLMAGIGHQLPVRCYIGYLNGKPVATSLMFLAARVAGIYNVATLPEARRRGLGTALTLAPLYEARDMGYRVATLQSSEHGVNLYRQLGFQPVCQMVHYYLGE
jgi:ribosomal protein S18 acetylase RimI-like enzyme